MENEAPNPNGRPSIYSQELVDHICEQIISGRSLKSICRDEGMPVASTVFLWLAKHQSFSDQYAIAMEARTNALAEEILEIADDNCSDLRTTEDGREIVNTDVINRARLRVDTRKWLMSKMAPRKYGDRQQLDVTIDERPIDEMRARAAELIAKAGCSTKASTGSTSND